MRRENNKIIFANAIIRLIRTEDPDVNPITDKSLGRYVRLIYKQYMLGFNDYEQGWDYLESEDDDDDFFRI